jgi:hypothetical protein
MPSNSEDSSFDDFFNDEILSIDQLSTESNALSLDALFLDASSLDALFLDLLNLDALFLDALSFDVLAEVDALSSFLQSLEKEQSFEILQDLILRINEHAPSRDYAVILLHIKKIKDKDTRKA